jgi:hypothetical protein
MTNNIGDWAMDDTDISRYDTWAANSIDDWPTDDTFQK